MSTTMVISVGRHLAGTTEPLPDDFWQAFMGEVRFIATRTGQVVFAGEGAGYDTETGEIEPSFTIILVVGEHSLFAPDYAEALLGEVAAQFQQAWVAVTYGETTFVEGYAVAA